MIIQCEQCHTRFRLDDSKVTEKGVKVRCAKCKHVFTVRKEKSETGVADSAVLLEQTPAAGLQANAIQPPFPDVQEPAPSFSFDDTTPEESFNFGTQMESSPLSAAVSDADSLEIPDQFSFSSPQEELDFAAEPDQKQPSPGDVSFDEFDFGDSLADGDSAVAHAPTVAESVKVEEPRGLDFSDDDMFGAVVQPPTEEPGEAISFDFGTDSFADSMDIGDSHAGQTGSSSAVESTGDAPFSLGEIDFGEELTAVAVQQVNPDELKPSQEILFSPLVEAQEKTVGDDSPHKAIPTELVADQEELPPLSISSRRKQNPLFAGLIAAVALLVVGVLGYLGFSTFFPDKAPVVEETGKISVRSIKASYLQNAAIGTLLVISGEALNEYSKPRAALQVKGTMLGATGQVLASKSAYCGNLLTNEQLVSLPLENIEAAMANQFGDSLANLEVAPGKAVPFTIVIAKPPKEGKDFAVEPVGSTVAAGKQQ